MGKKNGIPGIKHSAKAKGNGTYSSKNDQKDLKDPASHDEAFKEYEDDIVNRGGTPYYTTYEPKGN